MRFVRAFILICTLSLMPLIASADSEIAGWGEAKWGMTHSALKKYYEINPWEPGSVPTCKSKKKIRIWGRDFSVAFYFDERTDAGRLFKVALVHFDKDLKDSDWLNSIKDMLVEKYGTPDSFIIREEMKISQWKDSAGELKLTTMTGRSVMCALEYMAVNMERKKL